MLAEFGLGRAHHRVLHFVNRHPGAARRRPARDPQDHQAEPGPRAQAARRSGLDRAEGRRARPPPAAAVCDREGRGPCRRASTACSPSAWRRPWPRRAPAAMAWRPLPVQHDHRGGAGAGRGAAARADRGSRRESQQVIARTMAGWTGMDTLPDNAAHILIVDDDQRIRDLLARYLFEQGFRVTHGHRCGERARGHARPRLRRRHPRRHDARRKRPRARPRAQGDLQHSRSAC